MSKRNEKISAYLDGEIHQDEIMSFSLSGEAEDAGTSMRYRFIGDALRGEVSELSTLDVSAAVREALADENIADQMSATVSQSELGTSAGQAATSGGLLSWLSLRPLSGMAIAATVAGVMVFSVTQQTAQTDSHKGNLAAVQTVTIPQQVQPAQLAAVQVKPSPATSPMLPTQSVPVANNAALNPYLNEHFATQGTLQSRMPYVRAVSYESEK